MSFEDMINEKINTLSMIAEDIPDRIEHTTENQLKREWANAKARDESFVPHSPVVVASPLEGAPELAADGFTPNTKRTVDFHVDMTPERVRRSLLRTTTPRRKPLRKGGREIATFDDVLTPETLPENSLTRADDLRLEHKTVYRVVNAKSTSPR